MSEWSTRIAGWWTDDVSPWFTAEKWNGLFDVIKASLSAKWSEAVSWWENSGASKWIKDNVTPLFKLETWKGYYGSVKEALSSKWGDVVTWWSTEGGGAWIDTYVVPLFKLEAWEKHYENISTALKNTFKNGINGAIALVNRFIGWLNEKMHFKWDAISIMGQEIVPAGSIQLFTIPTLPKLASGGVLTAETAFIGGEYAGASSNPEIVAPQSIMQKTFLDAVWPLVDAVLEGTGNVTRAIEDKDANISVDGVALGRTLQKPMQRVAKQKGGSLIVSG